MGRRGLAHLVDTVVWVQFDIVQAQHRGIAGDGGDDAAVSFWYEWMAAELPSPADQRPRGPGGRGGGGQAGAAARSPHRAGAVSAAPVP